MKSLEIVNILLEDVKMKNKYIFERIYNAPIATSDLEQIKQDLEVLEILRKNLYIEYDTRLYVKHSFDDEHKDFDKVKQWLEENENDK